MNLKEELDTLGGELLKAARAKPKKDEEPMHTREKVDIFKAVTAWYLGSTKKTPRYAPVMPAKVALPPVMNPTLVYVRIRLARI